MGTLYENIISLCQERGITGGRMCVDLKLSKGLMTKLKDNPAKTITAETAQKIADYFEVSVDRVLGLETEKSSTPEGAELEFTDMELLNAYKVADDVTKELIRRALGLK